jgi:predicted O-methyltransferase YrrM
VSSAFAESIPVILIFSFSAIVAIAVCWIDLLRRRIRLSQVQSVSVLTWLDIAALAINAGFVALFAGFALLSFARAKTSHTVAVLLTLGGFAAVGIYIRTEGRKQIQYQRPEGIVAGEFLVLTGAFELLLPMLYSSTGGAAMRVRLFWAGWIITGSVLIAVIVPRFLKRREEHRIIERVNRQGEAVQAEYTPATPECPHPERWNMLDSMTAEVEVLDFLKSLVMTVKPELVVETGTFIGLSAIKMAEGMKANGFGRIITCEFDPVVHQKAKERIEASDLSAWIDCRNQSSLDMQIDGTIDIFFSDSDINIREQEIRKFLPQISPNGIVLTHDASSHYKVVREAALRLEAEGLLSVVLVATPRGLVIAQKRAGRK